MINPFFFQNTLLPRQVQIKLLPFLFLLGTFAFPSEVKAQLSSEVGVSFWTPSDTLNPKRFWTLAGGGALVYTTASIGLYQVWYKDYPLGKFRIFDDWGEWENMDKWGHFITAYTESYLAYKGARWTGVDQKSAVWIGAGVGMLLQGTIEVMDGFSERWGFSLHDMAFNTGGVVLFTSQELLWEEQRIWLKVSSTRPRYSLDPITNPQTGFTASARDAAYDLFGSNFLEAFVKDYNSMTVWASINPYTFMGKNRDQSKWPPWLMVSVGIGADEIFGAYGNVWTRDDGQQLHLRDYTRYQQYYLSLDIDLTRIKTKSAFLKTVFSAINWIKIPAPTLEYSDRNGFRFHPVYW